jgi:hypothetical protein
MTTPRKPAKKSAAKKPAKTRQREHRRISRDKFHPEITGEPLPTDKPVARTVSTQLPGRLALPAPGATTPSARQLADIGTTLSLPETVARLGWSMKTAYRKVRAGELAGAHKIASASGETWVVPVATVTALLNSKAAKQRQANPDAAQVADLTKQISQLELELAALRAQANERGQIIEQLQNTMRALTVATEQLSQVNDERAKTLELAQQNLQAALNRRWFGRSKKSA